MTLLGMYTYIPLYIYIYNDAMFGNPWWLMWFQLGSNNVPDPNCWISGYKMI